ncbi:unnamed protein product, partial [Gulo gulo]
PRPPAGSAPLACPRASAASSPPTCAVGPARGLGGERLSGGRGPRRSACGAGCPSVAGLRKDVWNDTKEDVFVHQVSAHVNIYSPSFKGCEKKERGGCSLNYCSLQKGYYIQPPNSLAPTGRVGACLNV